MQKLIGGYRYTSRHHINVTSRDGEIRTIWPEHILRVDAERIRMVREERERRGLSVPMPEDRPRVRRRRRRGE